MNYETLKKVAEEKLFIIAEAGVNHDGDLVKAKKLVDVAKAAGCDAVKFQTWVTEKVYSKSRSIKPDYQKRTTSEAESEFDTIKKLELSFDAFRELKRYCDSKQILFFSTPDEIDSLNFLASIDVPLLKTASQDVTNLPFLGQVAEVGLPTIFSTGACTLSELSAAVEHLSERNRQLVILHCLSSYPAPAEQLNLNVIPVLRSMFGFPVGLSDHTTGVSAACAAVALGARFFEKHFTLDPNAAGPDHQASLSPEALKHYVDTLREVHRALGDGHKRVMPAEENTRKAFRRFLVTSRAIAKGEKFKESDFVYMKIGHGIAPQEIHRVVGGYAASDIPAETPFQWELMKSGGN